MTYFTPSKLCLRVYNYPNNNQGERSLSQRLNHYNSTHGDILPKQGNSSKIQTHHFQRHNPKPS